MGSLFKSQGTSETSAYMHGEDGSQRRNFDDGNRHGGPQCLSFPKRPIGKSFQNYC